MTLLTQLNHTEISAIISAYDLTLSTFKLLSGGSENTNYKLTTTPLSPSSSSHSDFVLTVCEQKSLQACQDLVSLLDLLQQQNFPSSQILRAKNGEAVSFWQGKPVIIKRFIPGIIVEDIPKPLMNQLGSQLAQLHLLQPPSFLPQKLSYGSDKFIQVQQYAKGSDFDLWLQMIAQKIALTDLQNLPKSLIHSDIFYNNTIVSEDMSNITIMDFEEAANYYRVFDIGMLIIGTCCPDKQLDFSKIQALIFSYQQHIQLLPCEINALQTFTAYAAAATGFWRHINFNFINFDENMTEHYLAMKNLADHVLAIPAQEFIEHSNLKSLR